MKSVWIWITWQNNLLMKHISLFSTYLDLKRDMSWKSWFLGWGVFQVILKADKTTDWRNTDHCFLVSWIWKGTCPGNQGFPDEAYFKSYWNLTKQLNLVHVVHRPTSCWSTLFEGVDFFMLYLHQSYGGGTQRSRPPQMPRELLPLRNLALSCYPCVLPMMDVRSVLSCLSYIDPPVRMTPFG